MVTVKKLITESTFKWYFCLVGYANGRSGSLNFRRNFTRWDCLAIIKKEERRRRRRGEKVFRRMLAPERFWISWIKRASFAFWEWSKMMCSHNKMALVFRTLLGTRNYWYISPTKFSMYKKLKTCTLSNWLFYIYFVAIVWYFEYKLTSLNTDNFEY